MAVNSQVNKSPISISNTTQSVTAIRTASRRLTFFFRRGNKEGRERQMRELFQRRAKGVVKKTQAGGSSRTRSSVFNSFFLATTPFIGLKTRRRRRAKRVVVKLALLDRNRGECRSFIALSKNLQVSGAVSKVFVDRLERELEDIASKATTSSNELENQAGFSAIQEKRNEVHKLAYSARPFRRRRQKKLRRRQFFLSQRRYNRTKWRLSRKRRRFRFSFYQRRKYLRSLRSSSLRNAYFVWSKSFASSNKQKKKSI